MRNSFGCKPKATSRRDDVCRGHDKGCHKRDIRALNAVLLAVGIPEFF